MRRHLPLLAALTVVCLGCGGNAAVPGGPRPRLVGTSPALVRMTFDMGLGDHLAGVSNFSTLPDGEERPVVGDYLNVRVEPILAVGPDVVLTEADPSLFDVLREAAPHVKIEHFEIETLADVSAAMERIGRIAGRPELGEASSRRFQEKLDAAGRRWADGPRPSVMFVIGYEQPLGCGAETFIDEMITLVGGENVLAARFEGWKTTGLETVLDTKPDVVVCQCEPGREEETVQYWTDLGDGRFALRVFAVTDRDWTIPAGHLADYTEALGRMVHAQDPEEDSSP